jgi:hypothetical protein
MKKTLVAAAMLLTAVGAQASNFRGADQVYIPIAGHAGGGSGVFITDAYLSNLSADTVTISAIVQGVNTPTNPSVPSTIGTEYRNVIELAPYERKEFKDFFRSGLNITSASFGQVILNACRKGFSCGPDTQDQYGYSENFRPISVETRIYLIPTEGAVNPPTVGQLFSGIPWYSYVSELQSPVNLDKVFITGITQTGTTGQAGTYRTNIGLVNASQYSSTEMVVRAYQGSLTSAGFKMEALVPLTPLASVQRPFQQLFPNLPAGGNYFVTVEQRNSVATPDAPASCVPKGCPAFLAYGSVLDNVTGDATTLESQYLIEMSGEALDALYPPGSGKPVFRRAVRVRP